MVSIKQHKKCFLIKKFFRKNYSKKNQKKVGEKYE